MENSKALRKLGNSKIRRQYTSSQLKKALTSVRENKYTITEASRVFKIPRQTLSNKLQGKSPEKSSRPGPKAVLGTDVEEMIKSWILLIYKRGFCLHKEALLYSVKKIVDEIPEVYRSKIPFRNNTPGKGWLASFRKRHPQIIEKYDKINKAKSFTFEEELQRWSEKVDQILKEESARDVILNPKRIYLMDHIIVKLPSKQELILSERKKSINGVPFYDERDMEFLLAVNAEGKFASPMYVCRPEHSDIVHNSQTKWFCQFNESGALNCETFRDYIEKLFYLHLIDERIEFPVIVFLPHDFPFISFPINNFCESKGIIFICSARPCKTIPNFENMFFSILKNEYIDSAKNIVERKRCVISVMNHLISNNVYRSYIIQYFKLNQIFPFTGSKMNESEQKKRTLIPKDYQKTPPVSYMESKLSEELLAQFQQHRKENIEWSGDLECKGLYEIWLCLVNESNEPKTDLSNNKNEKILLDPEFMIEEIVEDRHDV